MQMRGSSRECKVVGGVKISGAAGGGSGGSETARGGGLKAAETGVDESERSIDAVKGVRVIGRAISRWCNGSPA